MTIVPVVVVDVDVVSVVVPIPVRRRQRGDRCRHVGRRSRSSVRTKRQKKDTMTPVEPPPAPVIATPYNMEKEAAP
jgi:hypothetical protein